MEMAVPSEMEKRWVSVVEELQEMVSVVVVVGNFDIVGIEETISDLHYEMTVDGTMPSYTVEYYCSVDRTVDCCWIEANMVILNHW